MTMAAELREEARKRADAEIVTTLATAFSNAGRHCRSDIFELHGESVPYALIQMRSYRRALQKYVKHKIIAEKLLRREADRVCGSCDYDFHCRERDKWRTLMDLIEFGLEHTM